MNGITRHDWKAERLKSVGASEAAAVMGMSPFATAYDVWLAKTQGVEVQDNVRMRLGRALEPEIVQMLIEHTGLPLQPCGQTLLRRVGFRFMHATPDCATADFGVVGDAKLVGGRMAHTWTLRDENELGYEAPDHYVIQVYAQMFVGGSREGYLAAAIDNAEFKAVRIERPDADTIYDMAEMLRQFWFDHVLTGVPPGKEWIREDMKAQYAKVRYERERLESLVLDGVQADAAKSYANQALTLAEQIKVLEKQKEVAETSLKLLMGDAAALKARKGAEEVVLATWKSQRGQAPWKDIATRLAEWTGTPLALVEAAAKEAQKHTRVMRVKGD